MQTLGVVEDTLFIPMLGRIYASTTNIKLLIV